MGCRYCKGVDEDCDNNNLIELTAEIGLLGNLDCFAYMDRDEKPKLKLWVGSDYGHEEKGVTIRYCPMCGRKL